MGSVQVIQIRGKRVQTKSFGEFEAIVLVAPRTFFLYLPRTRSSLLCRVAAEKLYRLRNGLHRLCRYHKCLSRDGLPGSLGRLRSWFRSLYLSRRRFKEPLFCRGRRRIELRRRSFSRTAKEARESKYSQNQPQSHRGSAAPFGSQILGRAEIAKSSAGEKPPLSPFDPLTAAAAIFRPIEHSHFLGSRHRVARSISQTSQ